jgi:hypothetical protein
MCSLREDSPQPIPQGSGTDAEGWERRERLNKSEAEMLLDWLEANGYSQREVSYAKDSGFTVRWRR